MSINELLFYSVVCNIVLMVVSFSCFLKKENKNEKNFYPGFYNDIRADVINTRTYIKLLYEYCPKDLFININEDLDAEFIFKRGGFAFKVYSDCYYDQIVKEGKLTLDWKKEFKRKIELYYCEAKRNNFKV